MRTAETVLAIIHDRGSRKLHLEDVYRQLFNPDLYIRAYGRIYKNDGAMTKGSTEETVDGMSMLRIEKIISALRNEKYQWTPVRRVNIPKKDGRTRPLGIPAWSDKLLQEVMRSILEAYYEPQFSDHSHGFRPNRGCHTALTTIRRTGKGTKWFIEGDIKGCFDNIDHKILLSIIQEKVKDGRFLRLIEGLLKAGYCEDWKYRPTLSGTPQGGVISPILSNIYLDRLDKYVTETLLPKYNRGIERQKNREYFKLCESIHDNRPPDGNHEIWLKAREERKSMPSVMTSDPNFRRLRYVRYADDFILCFAGPKDEADEIKLELGNFLRENLNLELSEEKTLVTHATWDKAKFLGYEISSQYSETRSKVNGVIALRMPASFIEEKCKRYMRNGKPIHRPELEVVSDFEIISHYQLEYRGCLQYYILAQNLTWIAKLHWVMQCSLLKTLAGKYRASVADVAQRYKGAIKTSSGPRKVIKTTVNREGKKPLVAYFGGIPMKYKNAAIIKDLPLDWRIRSRSELETRFMAEMCEVCESEDNVEVHHIRKLKDLNKQGRKEKPDWMQIMAARRRKTLVLCRQCHDNLHAGRPLQNRA